MFFIFLSPFSQMILFSLVNLIFLFTVSLKKLYSNYSSKSSNSSSPLLEWNNRRPCLSIGYWFKACFCTASILASSYIVLGILALSQGLIYSKWDLIQILFRFFQATTNLLVLHLIIHEKNNGALTHSLPLRFYWIANFLIRVPLFNSWNWEYIYFWVLYAFLFIVSVKGSTGIHITLIDEEECNYATASLFSKAVWNWMNPLLTKGYKSSLKIDDIPSLPLDHQAQKMVQLFESNWPLSEKSKNPVMMLLLRCFWKELAFIGFIAMVKLSVIYIGPLLIKNFISFFTGDRNNIFQGFYLVFLLVISKAVEVLSDHHFDFLSEKTGLLSRSVLVTALYRKGLQLSCSSRQTHGVGQIVNHMEVDCGRVSVMFYQLHNLWLMPFRVVVALLLLYSYIGISAIVSLIAVISLFILTLVLIRKNKVFLFNIGKNQDLRIKATAELFNAMRVIKFQAWEQHFYEKIQSFRKEELTWISKYQFTFCGNLIMLWSIPVLLASLTFGAATFMKVTLDAVTVFTATSIFKLLTGPIQTFPQTLSSISQAIISFDRLNGYLTSRELDEKTVDRGFDDESEIVVEVKDGSFSWEDEGDQHVLKDINFKIKRGEFAGIVGTTGSGKSSLLSSVLGELRKTSSAGKVVVRGTTAYVAQTAWIQNATIQENILFGSEMDNQKYNNVIRVCCLEKDLEVMEHGDKTEIGERGINLSGGQKQRIQLARAVYQDCDIYILDDIFSAVDAQTGSEIFKECIRGALKDKTILLVTHQLDFLPNADIILILRDGKIVQSGKYDKLSESGLDFAALVNAHETSMQLVAKSYEEAPKSLVPQIIENKESTSNDEVQSSKLIEDEKREEGHVSLSVYKHYCTEAGWWGVVAVILTSLFWQFSKIASDYWLAYETSQHRIYIDVTIFIGIYSSLGLVSCVFVAIRSFLVTVLGIKTAQSFFNQMLNSVLHAPMSFFDTTPSGRLLSRATSDQESLDMGIPIDISVAIYMYLNLFGILVITCQCAWPTIFVVIPLLWLNIWYQGYYISSSRELTRLNQVMEAPIIDHLSETLAGVMTIRCFRKQQEFFKENVGRVNSNIRISFHNIAANEWYGFRVELFGTFLLCISTLILILLPRSIIKPEYVGLSLSYGLSLNSVFSSTSYRTSVLEKAMVSVERIKQFIKIPSEADEWIKPNTPLLLLSTTWPEYGSIEIKDLKVKYRENTPLVLKGISLSINGGEKIGVVGRTGCGKSTLIQVLFRLVEPFSGKIIIDGIDICKLGLHDLRSRLGIIPQEPVLFEGTVRSNLDPLGLYYDSDIWNCLEQCQLKGVVSSKPEKLDSSVVDSGENWSVGQRQLLCLGRVLLKRTKFLFMDEATASVDSKTDCDIQKIIGQHFSDCTIITVAHRIPTVMDCHKVLVMDDGWVKEYDSPSNLMSRASLFGALVQEYGNRASSDF